MTTVSICYMVPKQETVYDKGYFRININCILSELDGEYVVGFSKEQKLCYIFLRINSSLINQLNEGY